jgi:hypothetical protein
MVTSNGNLLGPKQFFGSEFLLSNHTMKAGVTSLTFVDAFCIAKDDLMKLLDSGQFPFMQVLKCVSVPL